MTAFVTATYQLISRPGGPSKSSVAAVDAAGMGYAWCIFSTATLCRCISLGLCWQCRWWYRTAGDRFLPNPLTKPPTHQHWDQCWYQWAWLCDHLLWSASDLSLHRFPWLWYTVSAQSTGLWYPARSRRHCYRNWSGWVSDWMTEVLVDLYISLSVVRRVPVIERDFRFWSYRSCIGYWRCHRRWYIHWSSRSSTAQHCC